MSNRKILYGYQIRDGEIAVVKEEAIHVRRVFSLYIGGFSYQKISQSPQRREIPYSQEAPAWNKHKVKRLLENPRYIGRDSYPHPGQPGCSARDSDTYRDPRLSVPRRIVQCSA